jgi:hypothetical protein
MIDPPTCRRFQFRLRTLMVGVILLAVVCGYVGRQAEIVSERRSLRDEIARVGGSVSPERPAGPAGWKAPPVPQPNWLRRFLGDEPVGYILLPPPRISDPLKREIKTSFPEAMVSQHAERP